MSEPSPGEEPVVFRNTETSEVLRRGDGRDDVAHLLGEARCR